jgi:hypothetical protein
MAMILTDQIPRQHVRAQLQQARDARPASPLYSCAPSLSGAQHPIRQALHPTQHPIYIKHDRINWEKKRMQPLMRTSVGSSPKLRPSLTRLRVTLKAQQGIQQDSKPKNMLGQSLSPYVPDLIVQGAPGQRLAQHWGPSCWPCHNLYRVMSPSKA